MRTLNLLRIEAGCSIADLARLMRVDQSTACAWLSGHDDPDPEQRRKLATILHVEPVALEEELAAPDRAGRLRGRLSTAGSRLRNQHTQRPRPRV